MNSYTAAIRNYEKYLEKHKKRDRVEVYFLLGKLSQRRGQLDKAISYYDQYINSGTSNASAVVEAVYTIATLHDRLKRKKVTDEWLEKTVNTQAALARRGKNVGVRYAAEAKFRLVSKIYDDLVAIRIPANTKRHQQAIDQKAAVISRLRS
jgi:tetratricopeptide (TPR) repeat protein